MGENGELDATAARNALQAAKQVAPWLDASAADLQNILNSVGVAIYEWDIRTDRLSWSLGASRLLGIADEANLSTGRRYAFLFDAANEETPYGRIINTHVPDPGDGVGYELTYALCPAGRSVATRIWVEDTGRWFAGSDGKPAIARGAVRVINNRREREQRLAYLSRTDDLTGQLNRWALTSILHDTVNNAQRTETSAAFLIIAVDNLAIVNEAYGFDVADEVLRATSMRLRARLRGADSIGRYSGNKFGIILNECSASDMPIAAARLMAAVRDTPIATEAGPIANTVSTGGVIIPAHANTAKSAMLNAQQALDEAKRQHRDTFVAYRESAARESQRRRNVMMADMTVAALNDGRIELALQPIVSADHERPAFYECLMRLRQSNGDVMDAGNFLARVEKLGLARLLDQRMLELVIKYLLHDDHIHLALNISAETATDGEWLDTLRGHVHRHLNIAERLIVEVTETMAIRDIEETSQFISTLRRLGCKVAIDDFGAGYTSFRNLKLLDVDMVKIDGSFVERVSAQPDNQVFVRALIDLARHFGIKTVAEWVEHREDADLLKSWGVDYMQGHLFGAAKIDIGHDVVTVATRTSGLRA